jgi:thiazole synthase ThiGH ThiG subunit
MTALFHCFGANRAHRVGTSLAADMLRASRCPYLPVNTHDVGKLDRGDDLPIGYWKATLGSVRDAVAAELTLTPVLNINHPVSAEEAVARARRAADLTGISTIKLEVLNRGLVVSNNAAVVDAARTLARLGFDVWPLITPDSHAFRECVRLGSSMIRIMGSPIGTCRGIDPRNLPLVRELIADRPVPVMLDGGIGSAADVRQAFDMGFDAVLVNSCLFAPGADPVRRLREFRAVADQALAEYGASA